MEVLNAFLTIALKALVNKTLKKLRKKSTMWSYLPFIISGQIKKVQKFNYLD